MKLILLTLLLATLAHGSRDCRFALSYTQSSLLTNETERAEFIQKIFSHEQVFIHEQLINPKTGLTNEEVNLNSKTGMPQKRNNVSTPVGEALHLAVILQSLSKNSSGMKVYNESYALELLKKKVSSIQKFSKINFGFGGFLPKILHEEETMIPIKEEQYYELSAQGNGEFMWIISSIQKILHSQYPSEKDLIAQIDSIMKTQIKSFTSIFMTEDGKIRNMAQVLDKYFLPEDNLYDDNDDYSDNASRQLLIAMMYLQTQNESLKPQLNYTAFAENPFIYILIKELYDNVKDQFSQDGEKGIRPIAQLYEVNSIMGGLYLHSFALNSFTQTQFGFANYEKSQHPYLNTVEKLILTITLSGGVTQYFTQELQDLQMNVVSESQIIVNQPFNQIINDEFADFTSCRVNDFPKGFSWGTATAAYQIEGAALTNGRGSCIWDDLAKIPGRIANGDTANVADDFYHKFKEDVAMMKSLGLKNFRMSISWTRVLPKGTTDEVNQEGVDFYNNVFDELINAGIEPWVTLFHWDFPSALQDNTTTGAWLGEQSITQFNAYADYCFKTFGGKVKKWLTLNEPWTFVWQGYGLGSNAPGRCSSYYRDDCESVGGGGNSGTEPYIAAHNVIKAHATAYKTYKDNYQATQGGEVGIVINCDFGEPLNSTNASDIEAVEIKAQFMFGWFADPIIFGTYPEYMRNKITGNRLPTFTEADVELIKGSVDFLGLNHYTTMYVYQNNFTGIDWQSDQQINTTSIGLDGKLIGPQAQSTWLFVYPTGFRKLLNWVYNRYQTRFYVFENGVSVPGETQLSIAEAVHDSFRVNYYKGYISNMRDAITYDGVDVRGYFAWSLMDNYEWTDGYNTRFGMTYVDYNHTQTRYLKDSALWYSKFVQTGNINAAYENPYNKQMSLEQQFLIQ